MEQPTGAKAIRVGLIDDSVPLRSALRDLLEDEGFEVVGEAGNGLDGLDLIEAHSPDAVVLDLAMPGFDGLKTIPLIKQHAPQVKIVVLSLAGRSMEADALQLGADGYFGKGEPMEHVVIGLKALFGRA